MIEILHKNDTGTYSGTYTGKAPRKGSTVISTTGKQYTVIAANNGKVLVRKA